MRRITSYGPALVVLAAAGTLLFAVPGVMHAVSSARMQQQGEPDDDVTSPKN